MIPSSAQRHFSFPLRELLSLVAAISFAQPASADFGLITSDPNVYTVDTGAGLVFQVRRDDPPGALRAPGDICSLKWKGAEVQLWDRGSHLASGFPPCTIKAGTIGEDIVQITVDSPEVTHYYVARRGVPHIYMASYLTDKWPVGETRWVTHLNGESLKKRPICSDLEGTDRSIESRDVYAMPNGQTRSKYYGNSRAKELPLRGVTGPGIGVFMAFGSRETSSGGPFFRDIQNQSAEVYNYMNSGHNQTERFRLGLHGYYALVFTDGPEPRQPDFGFMDNLGIKGSIPASKRSVVEGPAIRGRDRRYTYTVALTNREAQNWADARPDTGAFRVINVKPGAYKLEIFKNELCVLTDEINVDEGKTTTLPVINISDDPSMVKALWRIGDWDGTPMELLNGDKVTLMHPSDVRMATWKRGPVLADRADCGRSLPCYQWRGVNDQQDIVFRLNNQQLLNSKLRIGITVATSGARPIVSVNGKWNSPVPPMSDQPNSRSMTIGTYRGNNATFTYDIPASALQSGTNTLRFSPISGSGGGGFLAPGYSIDCIDFIQSKVP